MDNIEKAKTTKRSYHWDTSLVLSYGLLTAVLMAAYYVLLGIIGLEEVIELRYASFFIMAAGAFFCLRPFYKNHTEDKPSYFSGLLMGTATNATAAVLLSGFILLTTILFSPETGDLLLRNLPGSKSYSMSLVAMFVMLESFALGLLASFVAMQYYK